ncbi:MAG: carbohydrate kinase family protein [Pseudomonadota bacterium]
MEIFVSGSLAYDRIMDFNGRFSDHILPDKIHMLNVCFTVNGLKEKFGGTAGNIAYALSMLGEKPALLASIGRDYEPYFTWLKKNGVNTNNIRIIDEELTAGAYITTDLSDNQITGFNPGAMKHPCGIPMTSVNPSDAIAVIAAGNLAEMEGYCNTCRENSIPYIFDPGQSLTGWKKDALMNCINGAYILISNDYELEIIQTLLGLRQDQILNLVSNIITTKAEHGSILFSRAGKVSVPAIPPEKVVDPTGAGDAYRGGLIKGLALKKSMALSALMGSLCASYAVACYGTQEYHIEPDEFMKRFEKLTING